MKTTGKPFGPINRTYDAIELLYTTNKTNEELLREKYPNAGIIKIKRWLGDNMTYTAPSVAL